MAHRTVGVVCVCVMYAIIERIYTDSVVPTSLYQSICELERYETHHFSIGMYIYHRSYVHRCGGPPLVQ